MELESGFCVVQGNLRLLNCNLEVGQIELSLTSSNSFQIGTRASAGLGSGSKDQAYN